MRLDLVQTATPRASTHRRAIKRTAEHGFRRPSSAREIPQVTVVTTSSPSSSPPSIRASSTTFVPGAVGAPAALIIVAESESTRRDSRELAAISLRDLSACTSYPWSTAPTGLSARATVDRVISTLQEANILPGLLLLGNLLDAQEPVESFWTRSRSCAVDAAPRLVHSRRRPAGLRERAVREPASETLGLWRRRDLRGIHGGSPWHSMRAPLARASLAAGRVRIAGVGGVACGTPVITPQLVLTEVGGRRRAVRVGPARLRSISRTDVRVLADRDLREDLRERGLKWVTRFSWSRHPAESDVLVRRSVRAWAVRRDRPPEVRVGSATA
jgi:hypothetical protein